MARYSPSTSGLEPGKRVGAGAVSKQALAAHPERGVILLYVEHESAVVHIALGETATLNAPGVAKSDGLVQIRSYGGALSLITSTEGANEKQTVTIKNAAEGTFTLTFEGKTTGNIAAKELTKEKLAEALEALSNIGEGDVGVTGEKGSFVIEFKGALKATDVGQMTADGSKLVPEAEKEASVTVSTETPGGVTVLVAEG